MQFANLFVPGRWFLLICGGFFVAASVPLSANAQIKSPDGKVEITVQKNGTIKGRNTEFKGDWEFPSPGDKSIPKGKNLQATFGPAEEKYLLYTVYGNELFCIDGRTGKYCWRTELAKTPKEVSFVFQGPNLAITIDGIIRMIDRKTGK